MLKHDAVPSIFPRPGSEGYEGAPASKRSKALEKLERKRVNIILKYIFQTNFTLPV